MDAPKGSEKEDRVSHGSREEQIEAIYKAYPKKLDKQPGLRAIRHPIPGMNRRAILASAQLFCHGSIEEWLPCPSRGRGHVYRQPMSMPALCLAMAPNRSYASRHI